jgi:hypothetical protein
LRYNSLDADYAEINSIKNQRQIKKAAGGPKKFVPGLFFAAKIGFFGCKRAFMGTLNFFKKSDFFLALAGLF